MTVMWQTGRVDKLINLKNASRFIKSTHATGTRLEQGIIFANLNPMGLLALPPLGLVRPRGLRGVKPIIAVPRPEHKKFGNE